MGKSDKPRSKPLHLLYLDLPEEDYDKFWKLSDEKMTRLGKLNRLYEESKTETERLEINEVMMEIISGPNGKAEKL